MDETILFPSPNWFQVSGLVVTKDSWLIYGGPSKSLCVLEPLPDDYDGLVESNKNFRAHVLQRVHPEKIVSVDVSPEWPEKRLVLTGSADGSVKLWNLQYENKELKIKSTLSHDIHSKEKEEIAGVGFSTDVYSITVGGFGHIVKWDLNSNVVKSYNQFLKSFKPVCMSCSPHAELNVAVGTKQGVVFVLDLSGSGNIVYKMRGHDDEIVNVGWCPQFSVVINKTLPRETDKDRKMSSRIDKIRQEGQDEMKTESDSDVLEQSGTVTKLPDDSFDNTATSEVEEDDMFDIYKDHEADEFGHKKFVPKQVRVKVDKEVPQDVDYLTECLKLKEDILNRKNSPEPSIESLVDALDNTHVREAGTSRGEQGAKDLLEASEHKHKHLLASLSKHGGLKVWSKSGKIVASCVIPSGGNKNQKFKSGGCATLLWYKPDVLLIADGRSQLLECNPLLIDNKNKLEWRVVHALHRRGLFFVGSEAPRTLTGAGGAGGPDYALWTAAQDRTVIRYSYARRERLLTLATCGGHVYTVETCPYDANKVAASVGDGAVRVWADAAPPGLRAVRPAPAAAHWQNVQGKVLTAAWHPARDALLAFGTAEGRVGLLDAARDRPARVLPPGVRGAVYALRWGAAGLYAAGGGRAVLYRGQACDEVEAVDAAVDGSARRVSALAPRGALLAAGTECGAVLVRGEGGTQADVQLYGKMIHSLEWHPQQTTDSAGESPYCDLLAACSLDKQNTVVVLQYREDGDGARSLAPWRTLAGHAAAVLQLAWSPHDDATLLSTSHDGTVRVWEVEAGTCSAVFAGHRGGGAALCAAWAARPALRGAVLSGGADCCVRLWTVQRHAADRYTEPKHEHVKSKKKSKQKKVEVSEQQATEESTSDAGDVQLASVESKAKVAKKFLLPSITRQVNQKSPAAVRRMMDRCLPSRSRTGSGAAGDQPEPEHEHDLHYLKMFGTINDVNDLLDMELSGLEAAGSAEAAAALCILRGDVPRAVTAAAARGRLDPFLLALAPHVSHKYWKDAMQLYLTQIDRLISRKEEYKLKEGGQWGGAAVRRALVLLGVHDARGALRALADARLYAEAYLLCRTRHMESVAAEVAAEWAAHCLATDHLHMAAVCHLAAGDARGAAAALARARDPALLRLGAELATRAALPALTAHLQHRHAAAAAAGDAADAPDLGELPTRADLLAQRAADHGPRDAPPPAATNGHGDPTPCDEFNVDQPTVT